MPTATPDGLIPISIATLSANMLLCADVYLRPKPGAPAVLFFSGNSIPDLSRLSELVADGNPKLFIDRNDRVRYQDYLRENWQSLSADQGVEERVAVLGEVMREVLSKEFREGDTERIVDVSKNLVRDTCELMHREPLTVRQLCNVLHHDYATFTHVSNVSMYCVLLAKHLGYGPEGLEEIAIGGLLHDIGKLQIDDRILTKPGKLDEFEFREIQRHPTTGFRELVHRQDLNVGQLMMCYQHHERLDGSGYPVACTGDEIHPWARLCAICDVFEALTSYRPYRMPMSFSTALAVLKKGEGTEFDSEMLECWRALIKAKQPREEV